MKTENYPKIIRVTEKTTQRQLEIFDSEVSMLGRFEGEKPLNDFLTNGMIRYGCWKMQLKDGKILNVCGEVAEYDKAVRYLIRIKSNNYDKTKKKSI